MCVLILFLKVISNRIKSIDTIMKCPYCGQEHPDSFKFCPNTAKQLSPQFMACTNEQCVDLENIFFLLKVSSARHVEWNSIIKMIMIVYFVIFNIKLGKQIFTILTQTNMLKVNLIFVLD